jgi:hypothetical protein
VRILSGIGAALFVYLALIPAGAIGSLLDSSCAGEGCETSALSKLAFTALYGACLGALLLAAGAFAAYAGSGRRRAQERQARALALAGGVVFVTLFVLFAVAFPGPAAVALLIAGGCYLALTRLARRRQEPDPRSNGHRSLELDGLTPRR